MFSLQCKATPHGITAPTIVLMWQWLFRRGCFEITCYVVAVTIELPVQVLDVFRALDFPALYSDINESNSLIFETLIDSAKKPSTFKSKYNDSSCKSIFSRNWREQLIHILFPLPPPLQPLLFPPLSFALFLSPLPPLSSSVSDTDKICSYPSSFHPT